MRTDLRILVALGGSGDGGTDRTAKAVAVGLARTHDVAFLAKQPLQFSGFLDGLPFTGDRLVLTPDVRELRPSRLVASAGRLARLLRRSGVTHVNFHYGGILAHAGDALAARWAGIRRTVVSLHHPQATSGLPRAWRLSHQIAARWTDVFAVTTPYAAAQIRHLSGKTPVEVVPLGCPPVPEIRRPDPPVRDPRASFVVGVLARLVPEKRVDRVIEACRLSRAFARGGYLLVAGDGLERSRLEKYGRESLGERVSFLGRVQEPAVLYRSADIFMLLSEFEGFGLVFAEAASAGVPSICSDAGGASYVVEHGRTGWLVPDGEPGEAARFLDEWAESPTMRENMRLACIQVYRQRLTEEQMLAGYERLILGGEQSSPS